MSEVERSMYVSTTKFVLQVSVAHLFILYCDNFRWREVSPGKWRGVIGKYVWTLFQDDSHIIYENHNPSELVRNGEKTVKKPKRLKTSVAKENGISDSVSLLQDEQRNNEYNNILTDYFQLNISLEKNVCLMVES